MLISMTLVPFASIFIIISAILMILNGQGMILLSALGLFVLLQSFVSILGIQLAEDDCPQVDVGVDSEKLEYIGWGPKAPPSPADPPGQPRNLDAAMQGAGTVLLDWKAPARGSGGNVRTYVIESRQQPQGGVKFGEWQQIGIALESETTLMNQPRGLQLEYRVKAINTGGESSPSNTVAAVL